MRLSRAEWTLIAGVLLVVSALVFPLQWAHRINDRWRAAHRDMDALLDAGMRFNTMYRTWPTGRKCEDGDCRFGRVVPNREVIDVLRAIDGPGNEHHSVNTNRTVFLQVQPAGVGRSGVDANGDFVDPWGTQYQIVLDTDLSGYCDVTDSIYGRGIDAGMIVWSCGADRISDTADDILSWKREGR